MGSALTFTILTAIKGGFADFRKTIPTVLAQTDRDFEWIIVDDASEKNLQEAFPELRHDTRVRIIRNDSGLGQTRSLNLGIREAKGHWIVRMDGDDLCALDRLARIRETAQASPAGQLIFTDYMVIDGHDRAWAEVRLRHPLSEQFFNYLNKRNNPICHPTVAFHRLKANGSLRLFREDLSNAQDYALWKELLHESGSASFVHLPSSTVSYRIVRHSLSGERAPEQKIELHAIREGQFLSPTNSAIPTLGEIQKEAMQAYRLLYYRFVGHSHPGTFREDCALLCASARMPSLLPKTIFYFLFRPFRRVFLSLFFGGIYE